MQNTPPTAVLSSVLQIFTVLKGSFPLDCSVGLGKVLHHVSSLNKAWLKGHWCPQHRLVLVAVRPANNVSRDSHFNRKP